MPKQQIDIIMERTLVTVSFFCSFALAVIVCSQAAFGQASQEHFQNGITKQKQLNFEGAIIDYNKAIEEDNTNEDTYFNRGSCELALKDFKSALTDFNKTIEIDPQYVKAYYSRATVYVSRQEYTKALPDLDKTIELDQTTPNALTLRGQIRAQTGNQDGACEDFNKAKLMGDPQADKYLYRYCADKQQIHESLMLDWPDSEDWKVGSKQENRKMTMLELIHSNETLEKWTEFGSMMSIKGATNIPMDTAMNMMFNQAKQNSPNAKLTFIEKDESVTYPWIIFTIETPDLKSENKPESQLWYIVQGKIALYVNFRAVKQATISSALIDKWIKFFKTGKVVNQ